MKVEVGESLIRSWLRHVEKCELAELNWKPSNAWEADEDIRIVTLFENAKSAWPEAFGQNTFTQFMKQAEVDVLGVRLGEGGRNSLHMVDVAFHSGGLNYGSRETTRQRVFKKLVRSALLALFYFKKAESRVYFVSPFVSAGIATDLDEVLEKASSLFSQEDSIEFEVVVREDFKDRILYEVLKLDDAIADTSEIFTRSWQLIAPYLPSAILDLYPVVEETNVKQINQVHPVDQRQVLVTALFLARFEHHILNLGNQTQTFNRLADILNVNRNTLKNHRDRFDYYVDNHRNGWNAPLPASHQEVLDMYRNHTEVELRKLLPSMMV